MPIADIFKGITSGILSPVKDIVSEAIVDKDKKIEIDAKLSEIATNAQLREDELIAQANENILKDMSNARDREIQISTNEKAPKINKVITPILAIVLTIGFFGILLIMIFHLAPLANQSVLNIMLGSLGMAWGNVVSYYFGSSQGSADKSKQLEKLTNK